MKTRFVLENAYEITHHVRSIPNTLSVVFMSVPFFYTALTVFRSIVFTSLTFLNAALTRLPSCWLLFTTLSIFIDS